ncbi:MAG: hypothetical protein ACFE0Q_16190 [Anaerolineae bacterium]
MIIHTATLDDSSAISTLCRERIQRWQRMDADGQVHDLPYEQLSIYERWLHGGAWMSVETGAIWLTHLAGGAGLTFVANDDHGTVTGYAEAFIGQESDPYGYHLHIGRLIANDDNTHTTLITHLIEQAGGIGRVTVAVSPYDTETLKRYQGLGFSTLTQIQQVTVPANGATAGFYQVTEHPKADAGQIADWQMPIGRTESARLHWETHWPRLWHAIPRLSEQRQHRLRFNTGGQDALVFVQEQLYNPRHATVLCWTPKTLSTNLIGAIRDWAYKTGYRSLQMAVSEKIATTLDTNLEKTPYQTIILARKV